MKDKDTKLLEEAYKKIIKPNNIDLPSILLKNAKISYEGGMIEVAVLANIWEKYYKPRFTREDAFGEDIETKDGNVWSLTDNGKYYVTVIPDVWSVTDTGW